MSYKNSFLNASTITFESETRLFIKRRINPLFVFVDFTLDLFKSITSNRVQYLGEHHQKSIELRFLNDSSDLTPSIRWIDILDEKKVRQRDPGENIADESDKKNNYRCIQKAMGKSCF